MDLVNNMLLIRLRSNEYFAVVDMRVIKPPHPRKPDGNMTVFLGGSIEMGKAGRWQDKLISHFKDDSVTFWNPRRDDWDETWEQDPTPGTEFHGQVTWEFKFPG